MGKKLADAVQKEPKARKPFKHKAGFRVRQKIKQYQKSIKLLIPEARADRKIRELLNNHAATYGIGSIRISEAAKATSRRMTEAVILKILAMARTYRLNKGVVFLTAAHVEAAYAMWESITKSR